MEVVAGSSNTPKPKPHEALWYSDGSIVLATDLYLFKVHKSFLARHSSVFRDLFDFSSADASVDAENTAGRDAATQEMYEGLPLVTLAGDKGEDIARLLKAVYEPRYHDKSSDKTPLETVIALLLLSTKYDFKDIRGDVVFQISRHYPMDFMDYLSMDDDDSPLFGRKRRACHFPLLAAAFQANADALLPTLYFVCSGFSMQSILDTSGAIPAECLRLLLLGREELRRGLNTLAAYLLAHLAKGVRNNICTEVQPCLNISIFARSADFVDVCFSPYNGSAIFRGNVVNPICNVCGTFVGKEVDIWREALWDGVPSRFKLPEWSALKDEFKRSTEA